MVELIKHELDKKKYNYLLKSWTMTFVEKKMEDCDCQQLKCEKSDELV